MKLNNGNPTNDKVKMANKFCNYCIQVGTKVSRKMKKDGNMRLHCKTQMRNSLYLEETNKEEVLVTFRNQKVPGRDGLRAETPKEIAKKIAHLLAWIINFIISRGTVSDIFKMSVIKPRDYLP